MAADEMPALGAGCARIVAGVVTGALHRRLWVVLAALALTALALLACVRLLGISTNTVDMIDPDEPFRQHAKAFNAAFPQLKDTIVVVVDGRTPERAGVAAEQLVAAIRGAPTVTGVSAPGTGFLRTHGLLYLEPDNLDRLVDRLAEAQPLLATLAQQPHLGGLAEILTLAADSESDAALPGFDRLLGEMAAAARAQADQRARNLSWQALMAGAEDGDGTLGGRTRRFVVVRPELDYGRLRPAAAAITTVREAVTHVAAAHDDAVELRLTGEAVIESEELASVEKGGTLAGVLSLVAVSVILFAGFRGGRAVAACLLTLLAGLVWTAGAAAVLVGTLNLISVAFAVLFVGLGIDFCIHFALRYREDDTGEAGRALVRAGRSVGCAMLLSALCAAVGFLSFLPTAYRGLAELGLIAGVGMGIAVAASLTLLPVLLSLFGARRRAPAAVTGVTNGPPWLVRHRRLVLGTAVVLAAAGVALAPGIRFDMNPMNLRDADSAAMRAFTDLTTETETTPYVVNVLAPNLAAAETLADRFRTHSAFGGARTLASFIPDQQDTKLATLGDATFFLAPALAPASEGAQEDAPGRAAAYAEIRNALGKLAGRGGAVGDAAGQARDALAELGDSPDLSALEARWTEYLPRVLTFLREALNVDRVSRADLPADLRARWVSADGQARVTARPPEPIQENGALRRLAQDALEVSPRATGAPVTIHKASQAVVGAFVHATAYAAAAILVILAATLGRARDVLLALAPLGLAAVLTLATAAVAGIPLNFANVIVLPLLMGLGVSSGVHLVLRARQAGGVAAALGSSTPRAVSLSMLTTLASFGTLIVAEHRGMSSMGALLTIAVGFTLFAVLVVLPALLAALSGRSRNNGA